MDAHSPLEREARVLTRYLLDRECPADCIDAYLRAHEIPARRGWQQAPDPASRFALSHPWSIEVVDAAGAITRRATVLRAKLLLMSAILETSPAFADEFLARRESAVVTVIALGWSGLRAAAACFLGLPLVLALGRKPS
jgi:hypothetical protein